MRSKETQELLERIFRFNKLATSRMQKISDCSPAELKMLGAITAETTKQKEQGMDLPGVSVSRISELLLQSKPATSKMLNALEERGEIERIYSKLDRRTVYIIVTEKGQQRSNELKNHYDMYTNLILERLGEEKTGQLFDIMDSLYEIVKEIHESKELVNENNQKREKEK